MCIFEMMQGIKTSWLMWALACAVLSVSALQVIGMKNAIDLKRQIFDSNVERSLNQISEWVLVSADISFSEEDNGSNEVVSVSEPLSGASRPIILRMESMSMDSTLRIALDKNGINSRCVFGVFDNYGQPVYLDKQCEPFRDELVDLGYSVELKDLHFKVFFPRRARYLVGDSIGAFVLSGLLLIGIFVGLVYVFYSVRQSKHIERIRRDLMNNLTHELKTPISTIGLASEALSDKDIELDGEQQAYYLDLIKAENKRLGLLVQKVLQASLVEKGSMKLYLQPINIHDTAKEVVKNVAMQVRKMGGKIELDLKASNPIIKADKTHLTSVIFNLIDNALKYSSDNPRIKISSTQTDEGVEFRVRDNGVGIPKEHLGKVFERLYRVPTGNVHDVKGFGLGLSYVKTVVERHGGSIDVESELGSYSVFCLKLKFDPPQE
jgi:two-component system phosphate regulon sensor histidine kinase PhoR